MMRILRAFAWLRWRTLMNSIERSSARDTLERFSLALEQLGPIMAAVMMIPSAIAVAGAGAYGGWALAQGHARPIPFEVLRFLLLAAFALTVAGPFMFPVGERTHPVRLLLLPVARPLLYVAQAATALTDPWLLLVVPAVAAVPLGLAAGGAWGAALTVTAAGLLLLVVLVGIASLATSFIHLVLRDRRRGEFVMLLLILVIPFAGMLPGVMAGLYGPPGDDADATRGTLQWLATLERRVLPIVPSELFVEATRRSVEGTTLEMWRPVAALAVISAGVHALGLLVFGRVLNSPGTSGSRRRSSARRARTWNIPGVATGTSAIAVNQIRIALRTPRGRSILLSPIVVFFMFAGIMWRGASGAEFGFIALRSGVALAIFGSFVSLLAILPIAVNQFAIDRAGLTLAFLSPLDDHGLLRGKAIGNGVIAGVPSLVCIAAAATLFPGASLATWMTVPPGIAACYLLATPAAAVLSALFPRAVDLNSIGRGSNAHGAAALMGLLTMLGTGALSLLIAILSNRAFHEPRVTLLAMLIWCAICGVVARLLLVPARAVLARRRENIALTV